MTESGYPQAREQFERLVTEASAAAAARGRPLSLLFIDVDQFRDINERYGHDVGDQVLAELPPIIGHQLHDADALTRWGGEEFAILVPDKTQSEAKGLAEAIRSAVQAHAFPTAGRVTISVGVTTYRTTDTPATLVARAERAVIEAKRAGRNRVSIAS